MSCKLVALSSTTLLISNKLTNLWPHHNPATLIWRLFFFACLDCISISAVGKLGKKNARFYQDFSNNNFVAILVTCKDFCIITSDNYVVRIHLHYVSKRALHYISRSMQHANVCNRWWMYIIFSSMWELHLWWRKIRKLGVQKWFS